jgi:S-formylglutathione hydrolase FrmB
LSAGTASAIIEVVRLADVSLLHGWFPAMLGALALGSVACAVFGRGVRWLSTRALPISVVAFLIVVVVNAVLDLHAQFDEPIPLSFLLYATMPVLALGLSVVGWRGARPLRRAVSVLAIPLTTAFAANLVNQYYAYDPTLGALYNADIHNRLDSGELGLSVPQSLDGRGIHGVAGFAVRSPIVVDPIERAAHAKARHGFLASLPIPGTLSGFAARDAFVWVPPAFFDVPRPRLPVVLMLSAVPGDPINMIRSGGAAAVADRYVASHGGVAPILVFPDDNGSLTNDTECVNSRRGDAETYLSVDVPAFISSRFSAAAGPAHWALEGYSEGGTCAMELALRHPNVFGSFVDIAGDAYPNASGSGNTRTRTIAELYGGDAADFVTHDPLLLARRPQDRAVHGWFEVGDGDHWTERVDRRIAAELRADGLVARFVTAPGGHTYRLAAQAVSASFGWLAHIVGG